MCSSSQDFAKEPWLAAKRQRVSYASRGALATFLEMDVDLPERELYAVNQSKDDFVQIPRWVRLLWGASRGGWMGAPPRSRR